MNKLLGTGRNDRTSLFSLVFVASVIFGMGSVCGTGIDKEVFKKGHRFQGHYVNTDKGVRRSFTFNLDGTVLREITSVGFTPKPTGDVAKENVGHGTYDVEWKSLSIHYDNGEFDNFDISLINQGKPADYKSQTPDRIQFKYLIYTRAD